MQGYPHPVPVYEFTWLCKGCQVFSLVGSLLRVFMRGYNCKIYPNPVPVCWIYLYNCISGLISLEGLKCVARDRQVRWLHLRKSVSIRVMIDGISDEKPAMIGIPTQWVDSGSYTYAGIVAIICTSTFHGLWLKLQWGICIQQPWSAVCRHSVLSIVKLWILLPLYLCVSYGVCSFSYRFILL